MSKLSTSWIIKPLNIDKNTNVTIQAVRMPKPCIAKTALIIAPLVLVVANSEVITAESG